MEKKKEPANNVLRRVNSNKRIKNNLTSMQLNTVVEIISTTDNQSMASTVTKKDKDCKSSKSSIEPP